MIGFWPALPASSLSSLRCGQAVSRAGQRLQCFQSVLGHKFPAGRLSAATANQSHLSPQAHVPGLNFVVKIWFRLAPRKCPGPGNPCRNAVVFLRRLVRFLGVPQTPFFLTHLTHHRCIFPVGHFTVIFGQIVSYFNRLRCQTLYLKVSDKMSDRRPTLVGHS